MHPHVHSQYIVCPCTTFPYIDMSMHPRVHTSTCPYASCHHFSHIRYALSPDSSPASNFSLVFNWNVTCSTETTICTCMPQHEAVQYTVFRGLAAAPYNTVAAAAPYNTVFQYRVPCSRSSPICGALCLCFLTGFKGRGKFLFAPFRNSRAQYCRTWH
jgi:hypothetical protein